jgi:hypothetical protein
MVVFMSYNFGSVWKNKKSGLTSWAMNCASQIPVQACTTLQMPIEAQPSATREQGNPARPDGSPIRLNTGV